MLALAAARGAIGGAVQRVGDQRPSSWARGHLREIGLRTERRTATPRSIRGWSAPSSRLVHWPPGSCASSDVTNVAWMTIGVLVPVGGRLLAPAGHTSEQPAGQNAPRERRPVAPRGLDRGQPRTNRSGGRPYARASGGRPSGGNVPAQSVHTRKYRRLPNSASHAAMQRFCVSASRVHVLIWTHSSSQHRRALRVTDWFLSGWRFRVGGRGGGSRSG